MIKWYGVLEMGAGLGQNSTTYDLEWIQNLLHQMKLRNALKFSR